MTLVEELLNHFPSHMGKSMSMSMLCSWRGVYITLRKRNLEELAAELSALSSRLLSQISLQGCIGRIELRL